LTELDPQTQLCLCLLVISCPDDFQEDSKDDVWQSGQRYTPTYPTRLWLIKHEEDRMPAEIYVRKDDSQVIECLSRVISLSTLYFEWVRCLFYALRGSLQAGSLLADTDWEVKTPEVFWGITLMLLIWIFVRVSCLWVSFSPRKALTGDCSAKVSYSVTWMKCCFQSLWVRNNNICLSNRGRPGRSS
jgi:hypothetical protein